ncbi:HNH endonuclease [Lysinibacillus sp. NPDC056185]|uniref:HNH endonuclease n=1 Tax=Lysinibacillus sp. NPDC056185 TaxID=3345739 RepID=UPI0039EF5E6C
MTINTIQNEVTVNVTEKKKRNKRNYMVEEEDVLKVYPNAVDAVPFIFDAEDRALLEEYTICRNKNGYAIANEKTLGRKVYLHRVVMKMLDKPSTDFIDHIDGDKNNNRKSNLRICHGEDATNQSNVHFIFPNGERVKRYRTPNDTFILAYTDGIMPYVEFDYYNYSDLIVHYKSLYEDGFEQATKSKLLESKLECLKRIETSKSKKEVKKLKGELNELDALIEKVKLAYEYARLLKAKDCMPSGLFFENKRMRLKGEIDKTPKEIVESGVAPTVIYFGNYYDKPIAGDHSLKPNGENIY